MMGAIKRHWATLGLIGLDVGLLAAVVIVFISGQHLIEQDRRLRPHALAPPDLKIGHSIPARQDLGVIRDAALFHTARTFYRAVAPSEAMPQPEYDVAGTMDLGPGRRVAFVKKRADHSSRTLHVGDDLEGWRVVAIGASSVSLSLGEQKFDLGQPSQTTSTGMLRAAQAPTGARSTPSVLGAQGTSAAGPKIAIEARTYKPPNVH